MYIHMCINTCISTHARTYTHARGPFGVSMLVWEIEATWTLLCRRDLGGVSFREAGASTRRMRISVLAGALGVDEPGLLLWFVM